MERLDVNWLDYRLLFVYFRSGRRHRVHGQTGHRDLRRLPPLRPLAAGLGDRAGLRLSEPRRARDPGHGGERRRSTASRPSHFYWVGAVPAMVFLGLVMMPFYYGSKVRSVPEYLRRRFNTADPPVQRLELRARLGADRRRQPVRAGARRSRRCWAGRSGSRSSLRPRFVLAYITLGGLSSRDLQRGAAVLRHPRRADPDRHRGPVQGRRLGRPVRPAWRPPRPGRGAVQPGAAPASATVTNPLGELARHRVRPRLRAVVRLLDHQLRRGAARAVGQGPVRRPSARRSSGRTRRSSSRP